ncbi:MAG: hypothetical protein MUD12_07350 [Spirochaetes bacterium]|nr:hypothetical protein [Spirochaetota bacterium]
MHREGFLAPLEMTGGVETAMRARFRPGWSNIAEARADAFSDLLSVVGIGTSCSADGRERPGFSHFFGA